MPIPEKLPENVKSSENEEQINWGTLAGALIGFINGAILVNAGPDGDSTARVFLYGLSLVNFLMTTTGGYYMGKFIEARQSG